MLRTLPPLLSGLARGSAGRWFARACVVGCALAVVVGLAVGGAAPALAADAAPAEAERDLARVRERIREVAAAFAQEVEARDQAVLALREAERGVFGARGRLSDVRGRLDGAERRRDQLRAQRRQEEAHLEGQRLALAGQLRAAYATGHAESARLLLHTDDPGALPRLLAWYGYFGRARAAKIAEIRGALERLDALDAALATQEETLRGLLAERAGEVRALETARRSRDQVLAAARVQVASRDAQLKGLRRQEARVTRLVERLQRAVEDHPFEIPPGGRAFARLRGQLPWPVSGNVLARYGQARAAGLKWSGLLIGAPEGTPVRAPYAGRVLYADWLQGLGNLLIVDHGGGWLTLYAHNAVLFKAAGERLEAGDVIAQVGDTGGEGRPALYFEIRQGSGRASRAVDPRLFLR